MNDWMRSKPPVTDVDLALYAEGLLDAERTALVKEFLAETGLEENDEEEFFDVSSESNSVQQRTQTHPDTDIGLGVGRTVPPTTGKRTALIRFLAPVAALSVAILIGVWGIRDVRAIELTLRKSEAILRSTGADLSPQVEESRVALEQLEGSFFLLGHNSDRRDRLLASIYVAQAELELQSNNTGHFLHAPFSFPPLRLCVRADALLRHQDASDPVIYRGLARIRLQSAKVFYMFGVAHRARGKRDVRCHFMARTVDSIMRGLEVLPEEPSVRQHQILKCGGLLLKAMHKGGLDAQPFTSDEAGQITNEGLQSRVRQFFGLSETDGAEILVDSLLDVLMQSPHSGPLEDKGFMDICNSAGLRRSQAGASELPKRQSIEIYEQGLQTARIIPQSDRDFDYDMTYGRLQGNIADAYATLGDLDREIEERKEAVTALLRARHNHRAEDADWELGWVTARQLIAVYRDSVRHPERPSQVEVWLGRLCTITSTPPSFQGLQLNEAEQELICAIMAEKLEDSGVDRGVAALIRSMREGQESNLLKTRHSHEVVIDFENNSYLQQHPEFREAIEQLRRRYGIETR